MGENKNLLMRTIKFRALDNLGAWIYGIPQTSSTLHLTLDCMAQYFTEQRKYGRQNVTVKSETLGQFTGLKDRNGKEVYEGDILSDGEKDPMILPVIYSDEYAMFCVDISYNKDGGSIEEILTCYEDGFAVVGNIHESPELLDN